MTRHKSDLLGTFAHHPVAANLLMLIMLLAGAFALDRLNVQFFPNFQLDFISVRVVWTGASAEDVETGITDPLEQRARFEKDIEIRRRDVHVADHQQPVLRREIGPQVGQQFGIEALLVGKFYRVVAALTLREVAVDQEALRHIGERSA